MDTRRRMISEYMPVSGLKREVNDLKVNLSHFHNYLFRLSFVKKLLLVWFFASIGVEAFGQYYILEVSSCAELEADNTDEMYTFGNVTTEDFLFSEFPSNAQLFYDSKTIRFIEDPYWVYSGRKVAYKVNADNLPQQFNVWYSIQQLVNRPSSGSSFLYFSQKSAFDYSNINTSSILNYIQLDLNIRLGVGHTVLDLTIHPIYTIQKIDRFIKEGENLTLTCTQKGSKKLIPNYTEYCFSNSNKTTYNLAFEAGIGQSPSNWHPISMVNDMSNNSDSQITFNSITSKLGSDIIGKELKVQIRQSYGDSSIVSTPVSFWILPSLTIDSYTKTDVSCNQGSNGSATFNIGNLPSTEGIAKYTYLVYQYSEDGSTATNDIKEEDRTAEYNGHTYKFQTAIVAADGETLTSSVNVPNLPKGIYKIKVYSLYNDTLYYPADTVIEITEPPKLLNNSAATNNWNSYQVATGASTANITIAASGGSPSANSTYYYSLDGGSYTDFQSPKTIPVDVSGSKTTKSITIKDTNECVTDAGVISLKQAPNIVIGSITVKSSSCHSADNGYTADGSASVPFSGGAGHYKLVFTNTGTTKNFVAYQASTSTFSYTSFAPGNYQVSITDTTNGPSVSQKFTIGQPDQLIIDNISVPAIACASDLASATINTANSGVYYYAVSGSETFESKTSGNFSKELTPGGTYQFYIQRATNLCKSATKEETMPSAPSPVLVTPTITNVSCSAAANGAFTVEALGGWPKNKNEYKFDIGDGKGYKLLSSATRSELKKDKYTVYIKDELCSTPYTAIIPIGEEVNQLKISDTTITNDLCKNRETGNFTGAISVTINKGERETSGYKARLTTLNGDDDVDILTVIKDNTNTVSFPGLKYGEYQVTVSEVNGCSDVATVTVGLNANPIHWQSPPATSNTLCQGVATGQITATATGGTAVNGYDYVLTGTSGIPETKTLPGSASFSSLAEDNYNLRVLDNNTCYIESPVTVHANPTPISFKAVSSTHIFCDNRKGSLNASATTTNAGISSMHLIYPNQLMEKISDNAFASVSGLTSQGSYVIRATDNIGCYAETSVYLKKYNNNPVITIEHVDSAACNVASNGSLHFKASQDTAIGGFVFIMADNSTFANADTVNSTTDMALFTELLPKTYYLRVADSMECYNVDTIILPVIHEPVNIKTFVLDSASCIRAANARATLSASGSIPNNEGYYFILAKDTLYGQQVTFNNQAVNVPLRIYLHDKYGCSASTPLFAFPVRRDTIKTFSPAKINPSCPGYGNGAISFITAGNDSASSGYTWQLNLAGNNSPVASATGGWKHTFNNLNAGNYMVTSTALDKCQAVVGEISITDPEAIQLSVSPGYVVAKGASTGWANALATGGNQKYAFEWYSGAAVEASRLISRDTSTSLSHITKWPAGDYLVRVKDTANCRFWDTEWLSKPFTIVEPEKALSLKLTHTDTVTCNGLLNGRFVVHGEGGWGSLYNYGTGMDFTNGASPEFSGLAAGTYTYYVKDTAGVTASATFVMTEPETLKASVASITNANCYDTSDGSIDLSVTGGNNTFEVSGDGTNWYHGLTLPQLKAGTYTVTVRDYKKCSSQATASITEPPAIAVSDVAITNTQCKAKEGSIAAVATGGVPAYTYQWYNNNLKFDEGAPETDSLYSGQYILKITDNHGCSSDFDFYVSDVTDLTIDTLVTSAVSCWGSSDGGATATVSKGFPPYTMIWNNTVYAPSITGLFAGEYLFNVSDNEGCKVYRNFKIGSPDSLHLTESIANPVCYGVADGEIDVAASGGTPAYSYLWSTGRKRDNITALDTGIYSITLTDSHGCISERQFRLSYQERITSDIPAALNLCKNNSYTIDGGDFVSYLWKKDNEVLSTERRFTITESGVYTFDFEDERGCQATDTTKIGLSESELSAQFLMASQVQKLDTVVIFEASEPVPDSIHLELPASFTVIDSGQYYRYVIVQDTGTFEITLNSFYGGCQAVIRKPIQVTEGGLEEATETSARIPLIVSAKLKPNPSDGNFTVEITLSETSDVVLRLVSFSNGSIQSIRKESGFGQYTVSYSVGHLPAGVYILNISAGKEMKNLKCIIL